MCGSCSSESSDDGIRSDSRRSVNELKAGMQRRVRDGEISTMDIILSPGMPRCKDGVARYFSACILPWIQALHHTRDDCLLVLPEDMKHYIFHRSRRGNRWYHCPPRALTRSTGPEPGHRACPPRALTRSNRSEPGRPAYHRRSLTRPTRPPRASCTARRRPPAPRAARDRRSARR